MEASVTDSVREDVAEKASEFLIGVLERMGISADIDVREEPDKFVLDVQTTDTELVIGRRGVVVDALQHVVNKVVYRERAAGRAPTSGGLDKSEKGKPFVVDAGGYRDRQIERLKSLAQRMAEKALATNEIVALSPMSPHDRRIVHMAIAEIPGLATRSEGEGDDRHILVMPAALASPDQPAK
jgi:spoIIIJ-associated protein